MLFFLICTAITVYFIYFYWKVSKYPKGPFPYPVFGNIFQITPSQLHLDLERFREQHGDVFTIWLMTDPIVVLMSMDPIKEALVTKGDKFSNRSGQLMEQLFQCTENGGVIFSSGENWREQRRTALHILRDFGMGKNIMEQQVHEQLLQFIDGIKSQNMEEIDFRTPIQVMVANVINQILFGFSYPHSDSSKLMQYADMISSLFTEMWESILLAFAQICPSIRYLPFIGQKAVGRHADKYNWCINYVKNDMNEALKAFSTDDEPSCFVQAYQQKMDGNPFLNADQLSNVCCDLFMAGMETTSTTLRWAVLYLAQNQDVQDKLRAEIASEIGFDRLPSLRDKNKLPYTAAVLLEVQRMANIIPINILHATDEETSIAGQTIPAGCAVLPQLWSLLMDATVFADPTEFRPNRFLNDDGSINNELANQMQPFGMGTRRCAGESLARTELFLCLTTFVQKFHFYPPKSGVLDMSPVYGTVLFPKTNLLRVENVNPEGIN